MLPWKAGSIHLRVQKGLSLIVPDVSTVAVSKSIVSIIVEIVYRMTEIVGIS